MKTSEPEDGSNGSAEMLYRRLAKLDPSEPAQATRDAILARAQQLAAARSAAQLRRAPVFRWGRSAVMGALAASILTALIVVPRYLLPNGSIERVTQGHSALPPTADQALQAAAPPVTSAADTRLAQTTPGSPEPTAPRAASRPGTRATAAAAAPAAKSAAPPSPVAQDSAHFAAFDNAQRATRQANAASQPAVPGRAVLSGEPPQQQLRRAAQAGDVAQIAALAPRLPDLNATDSRGRTAVMLATLHGQTAAVKALLSLGADPNVADGNGVTPLQAARAAEAGDIIAALERSGAR